MKNLRSMLFMRHVDIYKYIMHICEKGSGFLQFAFAILKRKTSKCLMQKYQLYVQAPIYCFSTWWQMSPIPKQHDCAKINICYYGPRGVQTNRSGKGRVTR